MVDTTETVSVRAKAEDQEIRRHHDQLQYQSKPSSKTTDIETDVDVE